MQAQVCAAGALLNILGPELERSKLGVMQRKGFGKVMSCLLTLSIVHEALFENMLSAEVAWVNHNVRKMADNSTNPKNKTSKWNESALATLEEKFYTEKHTQTNQRILG